MELFVIIKIIVLHTLREETFVSWAKREILEVNFCESAKMGNLTGIDLRELSFLSSFVIFQMFLSSSMTLPNLVYLCLSVAYRKSSIRPPRGGRAYSFWDTPEGSSKEVWSITEGSLFAKSDNKDIYDSLLVPLRHVLRVQHTILRARYIDSTQYIKPDMQTCLAR